MYIYLDLWLENMQRRLLSRRQVLATSGTLGATALAGCNALGGSDPSAIKEITKQMATLTVTLRSGDAATAVNFINPDGKPVTTKRISNGQTTVQLPLVQPGDLLPLRAGKYKVVAEKDNETVGEQPVNLTRSYKMVGTKVVNEISGTDFSTTKKVQYAADIAVQLKNTGDVPIKLDYLGATKGVPSPVAPPGKGGMGDTASHVRMNADQIPVNERDYIGAGQRVPFKTDDQTLVYYDMSMSEKIPWKKLKAKHCNGEKRTATLLIKGVRDSSPQRYSVSIQYGGKAIERDAIRTDWACAQASVTRFSRK
ncbi:hypothetical protein SAMN05444342_4218 [Haladaptatus paucihalophilus DX253]|nr:hypothetical protein SAMN05444342_4218 [Haladaptatus paucihalophilus DX253]